MQNGYNAELMYVLLKGIEENSNGFLPIQELSIPKKFHLQQVNEQIQIAFDEGFLQLDLSQEELLLANYGRLSTAPHDSLCGLTASGTEHLNQLRRKFLADPPR